MLEAPICLGEIDDHRKEGMSMARNDTNCMKVKKLTFLYSKKKWFCQIFLRNMNL